jgi:hypothetical protein
LAKRKINPPPSPLLNPIKFAWKVQCPMFEWTLNSPLSTPIQLEKKNLPSNLSTLNPKLKRKKTKAP